MKWEERTLTNRLGIMVWAFAYAVIGATFWEIGLESIVIGSALMFIYLNIYLH